MSIFKLNDGETLVIRKAEVGDALGIVSYIDQISKETEYLTFGEGEFGISEEEEAEFIKEISKSDNGLMICAFIDNIIVGQLVFRGGKRPRIRHTGEFGVSVLKKYWGLGIGRKLMEYMLSWAKESSVIRKVNLKVRSDNQAAISLYESLNFAYEGTITREFFINGIFYDSIHMGKEIG